MFLFFRRPFYFLFIFLQSGLFETVAAACSRAGSVVHCTFAAIPKKLLSDAHEPQTVSCE